MRILISLSGLANKDGRQFMIRSSDIFSRGIGIGAVVGKTLNGLQIFRVDEFVSSRGTRNSCMTLLINETSKQIVAEHLPNKNLSDSRRRALQNMAIDYAKKHSTFWSDAKKPEADWFLHGNTTKSYLDAEAKDFSAAASAPDRQLAGVEKHPDVKRFFDNSMVSVTRSDEGTWYLSGRKGIFISDLEGSDPAQRRFMYTDGFRTATIQHDDVLEGLNLLFAAKTKRYRG